MRICVCACLRVCAALGEPATYAAIETLLLLHTARSAAPSSEAPTALLRLVYFYYLSQPVSNKAKHDIYDMWMVVAAIIENKS